MLRSMIWAISLILWASAAAAAPPAKVYVVLWFDTEDYILPASDDAALRLATWLDREGVRAVFKVVGEKARTLERRGRTDVIDALKKHEIGYHANWHSVQPTPAMYSSHLGWDEGVAEFDRREGPGVADVQRIFGRTPSCYGQPGSSWSPQSFGAMAKWGVPIYLDAGRHISVDGRAHYFCGLLTLYHLSHTIRTNLGGEKDLKPAEERFLEARQKLLAEGGGIVSIVYHPCEFVHEKFWDGVNFSKGANPPREKWILPPQKTEEASKIAYDTFQNYIRFIKRFPEVQFVTAKDLGEIYRDKARGRSFTGDEIQSIAKAVGKEVSFQKHGDYTLSASEVFALLVDEFMRRSTPQARKAPLTLTYPPLGPTGVAPTMAGTATTDRNQFGRTVVDVHDYLTRHRRVPSAVWLGSTAVTPESFLVALAKLVSTQNVSATVKDDMPIELAPAQLAAGKHSADDGPNLWGWVIFPPGFRAPAMMELARKQTWTIKPAINHGQ